MSKKKRNQIRKDDYNRVLVTETLPFETPLIFSNDGLYECIKNIDKIDSLYKNIIECLIFGAGEGRISYTIPYLYKIRKNSHEFRRLALVHPRSQWKVKEFYQKYETLIAYHCSLSAASIRAPHRVASSFYVKNDQENLNQYKTGAVSLMSSDKLTKHAPSFFAYRGFDRLYKFFESRDYFDLEKQYSAMVSLDVSKCFDSIYTHTISWAVKDKDFTKRHMPTSGTFADEFDGLMMHANHSETNGIVIGPEVSRIFAEIIFQEIDRRAIGKIDDRCNWQFGSDYTFRRYVDDVFIFAATAEHAETIYSLYAEALLEFNLHANAAKRQIQTRPFVTKKSRIILAASEEVNRFVDKFLVIEGDGNSLKPTTIYSTFRLTKGFIDATKVLCSYNEVNYDEVASYLIAVLTERVKRLVAINVNITDEAEAERYLNAIVVLLDILYFLYEVSPSVGASYKFCTSIILMVRFANSRLVQHYSTVAQRVYELTELMLGGQNIQMNRAVQEFLPLEVLNVLLATRELGSDFIMPESTVAGFFCNGPRQSYFSIVSCLYYIQDDPRYAKLRDTIINEAVILLGDLKDVRSNSEKAYLLLDLLSCPFIAEKARRAWLKDVCKALSIATPNKTQADACLKAALAIHSHVNWGEVDLLSTLEKKELKRAY